MAASVVFYLCAFSSAIVFGAQPRSTNFITLDKIPGEPLGHYAKLLQAPLAFSYTQTPDSKPAESVIKHRLHRPEPTPVVRRLSSKRILMPKKYFKEPPKEDLPVRESEFLIYVPEDAPNSFHRAAIIETKEADVAQVAEASSEVKNLPKSDQHVQESHHEKPKPKPKPVNTKYEEGEEKTDQSEHDESSKKKKDESYKGEHVKHKVEKSHHIEKDKSGHYEDKGGDEKHFDKGDDYQAAHHEEDGGKKGTKYEEEGENDKGHATKGTHNVRKKDEYVKKIEFFDEYHEDSDEDEEGAHEDEKDFHSGHHDDKEHHDSAHHHDDYAEHKGHQDSSEKKYSNGKHDASGHDGHHDHDRKHEKKSNRETENKKIWKIIVPDKNRR